VSGPAHAPAALRAAQAGAPAAREALVRAHGGLVWSLCHRLADDPEDAWQSAWERVFGALHRFDPAGPASLATWIRTLTHRMLIDRHRRRRVRGEVVPLDGLAAGSVDPEAGAARGQDAARLERGLSQLPADWARLVVLHHVHGVPLAEIAEAEDVPRGTLKSRLHRARARLLPLLEGIPDAEPLEVDCSEMPCMAVIRSTSTAEDWTAGLDALHDDDADWGTESPVNVAAMASELDDDEDGAPPVRLSLVGAWPDDPEGPDVRGRLHTRSQDLLQGIGEDLMDQQAGR
jgi:RNA polymerase sigma-70 factor (ECF subfamily)